MAMHEVNLHIPPGGALVQTLSPRGHSRLPPQQTKCYGCLEETQVMLVAKIIQEKKEYHPVASCYHANQYLGSNAHTKNFDDCSHKL